MSMSSFSTAEHDKKPTTVFSRRLTHCNPLLSVYQKSSVWDLNVVNWWSCNIKRRSPVFRGGGSVECSSSKPTVIYKRHDCISHNDNGSRLRVLHVVLRINLSDFMRPSRTVNVGGGRWSARLTKHTGTIVRVHLGLPNVTDRCSIAASSTSGHVLQYLRHTLTRSHHWHRVIEAVGNGRCLYLC